MCVSVFIGRVEKKSTVEEEEREGSSDLGALAILLTLEVPVTVFDFLFAVSVRSVLAGRFDVPANGGIVSMSSLMIYRGRKGVHRKLNS